VTEDRESRGRASGEGNSRRLWQFVLAAIQSIGPPAAALAFEGSTPTCQRGQEIDFELGAFGESGDCRAVSPSIKGRATGFGEKHG